MFAYCSPNELELNKQRICMKQKIIQALRIGY